MFLYFIINFYTTVDYDIIYIFLIIPFYFFNRSDEKLYVFIVLRPIFGSYLGQIKLYKGYIQLFNNMNFTNFKLLVFKYFHNYKIPILLKICRLLLLEHNKNYVTHFLISHYLHGLQYSMKLFYFIKKLLVTNMQIEKKN